MDTRVIESNQNITVSTLLNNVSSWNSNIYVDFIPDVVVVRGIMFSDGPTTTEPGAFMIQSNLTPRNCVLGSFSENVFSSLGISEPIKKPINGLYNFQILLANGISQALSGYIYVHLDFIKYKQVTEQKIY